MALRNRWILEFFTDFRLLRFYMHTGEPENMALNLLEVIFERTADFEAFEAKLSRLKEYAEYLEQELRSAFGTVVLTDLHSIQGCLTAAIVQIKSRPEDTRREVKTCLQTKHFQNNQDAVVDKMLALAVRIMCATACSWPTTSLGSAIHIEADIFRPVWKESETLPGFLERVYPQSANPMHADVGPLRIHRLSAGSLTRSASITIQWTHQLSDHLLLLKGADWKSLYIYRHPSFLRYSLDLLYDHSIDLDQSTSQALTHGCLPPRLLREALVTYNILFPLAGDSLSRDILEKDVERLGLDSSLLEPSMSHAIYHHHESFRDALPPTDVRGLYNKYPYWADRLYEVWKEAEDPTPVTAIGRWSEARRNPRFTYWCTVVAVTLAFVFGIVTTILAAVQVWVSFCAWDANSTVSSCRLRGEGKSVFVAEGDSD